MHQRHGQPAIPHLCISYLNSAQSFQDSENKGPADGSCNDHICFRKTISRPGYHCERARLPRTLEAATTPVGRRSMTSLANEGPDRNAAGCLRPSALGISSLIMRPLPTSSPLLTDTIGTSPARWSCPAAVYVNV